MRNFGKVFALNGSTALTPGTGGVARSAKAAAAMLILALHMPAAQAQSATEIAGKASDFTGSINDLNDAISQLEVLNGSRVLQSFKGILGKIGAVSPYIGALSALLNLSEIGQPSEIEVLTALIEKNFARTNGKIDNLSEKMDQQTKTIIESIDIKIQENSVRDHRIKMEGAQIALNSLKSMTSNIDYRSIEKIDRNDFTTASVAAADKCNLSFLETVAKTSHGDIQTITEFGHFMLDTMYKARGLDGAYYIVQESFDNRYKASPETIKVKAREAMDFHNARIDACVKNLGDTLAKYSQPNEQMNSAIDFIKPNLALLNSPQAIVDTLAAKYPYENWVAVKYDSIPGNDDFAIAGGNMRLLRPDAFREWNLVLGFYKRGAKFANDRYFANTNCADAMGGLERGGITGQTPSNPALREWPTGGIGHGWDSFKKWCGDPPVNGFWISRGNTNAQFAISDREGEADYHSLYFPPSDKANAETRNRIAALQFMASPGSKGGSYLILPKPLEGNESSIKAQQAESARKAAVSVAATSSSAPPILSPGFFASYLVEIDFCHSDLTDTESANPFTVEFMSGGMVAATDNIQGSASDCGAFSKGIITAGGTVGNFMVDSIRITTGGGDAMFVDQVKAYRNGTLFIWEGRNNGGGWCLSTDREDFRGGWEANTSGVCEQTRSFSNPAN